MSKERPIVFADEMVCAILDGYKTQTRRVVKPQPVYVNKLGVAFYPDGKGPVDYRHCPYGQAGERLWVRETFIPKYQTSHGYCVGYRADMMYRCGKPMPKDYESVASPRWKPSIFMPRWASRITLEITDVRVERVQDISREDAVKEGHKQQLWRSDDPDVHLDAARDWFMDTWDLINGPRGYGWKSNPFVWVIEFKRLEGTK